MKIHSIFESISGEAGFIPQGAWCTFIRVQGCNLRCKWCDTADAQDANGGTEMSLLEIDEKCKTRRVIITGGEPLMQDRLAVLIDMLYHAGNEIQVETNGSLPPPKNTLALLRTLFRARWIVDYKSPSSGVWPPMPSPELFVQYWEQENVKVMVKFVVNLNAFPSDLPFVTATIDTMRQYGYTGDFIISPLDAQIGSVAPLIQDISSMRGSKFLDGIIFSLQLHKLVGMP